MVISRLKKDDGWLLPCMVAMFLMCRKSFSISQPLTDLNVHFLFQLLQLTVTHICSENEVFEGVILFCDVIVYK